MLNQAQHSVVHDLDPTVCKGYQQTTEVGNLALNLHNPFSLPPFMTCHLLSHLLMYFDSCYYKQYESRSDCSLRSTLIAGFIFLASMVFS